jgi:selenoprotein W-related protein
LTADLLKDFEHSIAEWKLIPSRGGVFEVTIDGELVFSKKQLGRHATTVEIRNLIETRLP